jgi:hypothetical protein
MSATFKDISVSRARSQRSAACARARQETTNAPTNTASQAGAPSSKCPQLAQGCRLAPCSKSAAV